ncbi:hypothetical protein IFM89_025582 [Coptis chinensis]|uniref:Adenylate-forming reductase n=1 Tax=Coptis chinensis TaxID=261450 RepID=A0A835GZB4_9MAGN|nr:hypothetical protein IFM89_025582 [Coptis chinensis]
MARVGRFSSCRGVSFEIQPQASSPFAIGTPSREEPEFEQAKKVWLPWNQRSSFKVFNTYSNAIQRTVSRPSSHFCDLDVDYKIDEGDGSIIEEYEEEDSNSDLEQQKELRVPSKREQPPKIARPKESRLSIILLDQGLFTVYKRLFVLCLVINLTLLILAASGSFPYAKKNATLFSIGNILALTLCRSEALLRVVFWLAVRLLGRPWVPLPVKTATTSFLQCLGGVHSGCGVSSIIWLLYSLVLTLKDRENTSSGIVAVASMILSLLCLSSLVAFPLVRHLHHNIFERTHRFAGWTALVLVWTFIILNLSYDPISKSYHNLPFSKLNKSQEFWFLLIITIVIILPWATVKRVPVKITAPSGHASIIKFEGGVEAGILGRISPSPLSEWHAFGIISDGEKNHMMLAGAVGDFTKSLVSNPPSHLWVRQVHFAGLPYLVNMYDRVLLVATGSGICVFLSFLMQPCSADVCLVWVAKGIEQNFGKEIKEAVSGFPKNKVIVHDTAVSGRPNVSQMSIDAAKRWGAQVVIVTSNPEGSRDVVNSCKGVGIAAFGPIWDS